MKLEQKHKVEFTLNISGLEIGSLDYSGEIWTFKYSQAFRRQHKYKPLLEFADVNKVYQSPYLWSSFALRIPSISRNEINEILKKESINPLDNAGLLKRFGRRAASNPYELIPV